MKNLVDSPYHRNVHLGRPVSPNVSTRSSIMAADGGRELLLFPFMQERDLLRDGSWRRRPRHPHWRGARRRCRRRRTKKERETYQKRPNSQS